MFDRLGKKRFLSKSIVNKLKGMKGFRNILVHRYGTVDDRLVYTALTEDVKDFMEFKRQVVTYLKRVSPSNSRKTTKGR